MVVLEHHLLALVWYGFLFFYFNSPHSVESGKDLFVSTDTFNLLIVNNRTRSHLTANRNTTRNCVQGSETLAVVSLA